MKTDYKYRIEVGNISTFFVTFDCAFTYFNACVEKNADVEMWHIIYSFRPDGSVVGTQVLLAAHYTKNRKGG